MYILDHNYIDDRCPMDDETKCLNADILNILLQ